MKKRYKNLIIAPHADDEVLGCCSVLNNSSFVYYCGIDESLVPDDKKHRIGVELRKKEICSVSNFLGFHWKINYASKVNHYKEIEFIKEIETLINNIKPEMIFVPFPSYNQDHRTIYNAARVALRPHDKNFFVKKVLVYEQCHSVIWELKKFKVNYFVPLDIRKKIEAYHLHRSQVRDMRSAELVKAIAKIRGAQINKEYAEGFMIERWVK